MISSLHALLSERLELDLRAAVRRGVVNMYPSLPSPIMFLWLKIRLYAVF